MEDEDDFLEEEQDKLNKELASVENSLSVLRSQNAQLQRQITDKTGIVNQHQEKIQTKQSLIERISKNVGNPIYM